ncbi:MAG: DNA primase [Phycisphaerales bacterium]|nr:MAG: DNA primase [Phycisphaerales bacterium]
MARQQSDIERVRQASDIVDVISEHLQLRRAGSGFKGLCPFHKDEKTPSFHVHPSKQIFKCFGCGVGGDVFKFVQLRENVDFGEALRILAARAGIALAPRSDGAGQRGPGRSMLARVNEWAARWFQEQLRHETRGREARAYVANRQVTDETVTRFGLGFAADSYDLIVAQGKAAGYSPGLLSAAGLARTSESGKPYAVFRNRLMFPIRDSSKRIIGFGGRALGDDPAKYLNTPETPLFNKGRELFGLDLARESIGRTGRAVVTEGYMDCLMVRQFGFDNVVAALGTSFTADQAKLLHRFCDEAILVFDSDEAGQRAAERALEAALAEAMTVRLTRVPEAKDPCDYLLTAGPESFEALLNSAPEALEFKWQQLRNAAAGSAGASESYRAARSFLDLVARSMVRRNIDPVHLGFIVNRISKLVALPAEEVYRHLNELKRQESRRGLTTEATRIPSGVRPATGAKDAAVREIMEVLLNAPEHLEAARPYLKPEEISDQALAGIVSKFCSACRPEREYDLAGFISGFEEPAHAALITDMQLAGERRGNYEATLQGAVETLRQERGREDMAAAGRAGSEPAEARLARVQTASQERHRFAGVGRRLPVPPDMEPMGDAAGTFAEGAR